MYNRSSNSKQREIRNRERSGCISWCLSSDQEWSLGICQQLMNSRPYRVCIQLKWMVRKRQHNEFSKHSSMLPQFELLAPSPVLHLHLKCPGRPHSRMYRKFRRQMIDRQRTNLYGVKKLSSKQHTDSKLTILQDLVWESCRKGYIMHCSYKPHKEGQTDEK